MAFSRDRRIELLAAAPAERLVALGERAVRAVGPRLQLIRPPETGSVVLQVREPVADERFYLSDVLVTRAEVALDDVRGWSMRLGDDRLSALAAAVLDAVAETDDLSLAGEVRQLCAEVEHQVEEERRREWQELSATIVQFEKLDQ